jgi:hypothetical protein
VGKRRILLSQFVVLVAAASLAAASGAAAGRSAKPIPDVTVLFGRAVKIVRGTNPPTFSTATMLEADGLTRGGRCSALNCSGGSGTTSASGIVLWRFVLDNQASGSRFATATLIYGPAPKGFGKVTGITSPFVEDAQIPKAPRMTLTQAVARLRKAGYRKPFFNVTLRNPLGPKPSKPLYIFGFAGGRFVAVNTVTNKVAPLS